MKKIYRKIVNVIFIFCMGFIFFIFIQVFFISSFKIPSDSMEPSLNKGDIIVVNKLIKGARLFNINAAINNEQFQIRRVPGLSQIQYNDVLVFNFPYSKSSWDSISFDIMSYYVKRCIALPSDTIEIQNGFFKLKNKDLVLGNIESQKIIASLPDSCKSVQMKAFPLKKKNNWTIKNFGPLAIPAEGQIIKTDSTNYNLYHQIISWEQRKKLKRQGSIISLGDSVIKQYQFQQNYYFVCGDKCENSKDSRYWGLLPEEFIVGKATTILYSKNPTTGKIRKDRIMKKII